ncbi:bacteriocin biosynthesis protein [Nocardiopsis sp. TSRI0078]|uniref:lactococcin 972 family bacteriocin n=1 Tax=unclassified Nocardiopsis TaxID=2649073 RepID=UPI00093EAF10|nr:lactococcin 972 family bacteriocin [Nocardiopsis sp. TSRI0078]OKI16982.1 bacteriocin biosynthesis protein [Nocardiopsis sp. TSRI0078]
MTSALKRTVATLAIAAGLTAATAGAAFAAVEYVGGGKWSHGFTGAPRVGDVYSNYYHGSYCHGSTAFGTTTDRATAYAGSTSYASATRAFSNNQTYWRYC